jgi:hypothetical protein
MTRVLALLCAVFAWAAQAQVQYTWTDITPAAGGVFTVGTHVLDGKRLVVSGTFQPGGPDTPFYRVMYSDDGGRSWKLPVSPPPDVTGGMFVDVALPGVVYITEDSSSGIAIMGAGPHEGHLYRSDDFGRSWSVIRTIPMGENIVAFGTDPLDARGLFASYEQYYVDGLCPGLCVRTKFTGITRSHNDGADWSAPSPLAIDSRFFVGPTPTAQQRLFAASQADGVYQSVDGGATWSKFREGDPLASGIRWIRPDPLQSNVLYAGFTYASGSPGIFYSYLLRSDDGGVTWQQLSDLAPSFAQLAIDPARPQVVWAWDRPNYFSRSEDRGNTWYSIPVPGSGIPNSVTFSPAEPNVVYVIQGSRLFRGVALPPQPIIVEYQYESDRYWLTSLGGEAVFMDYRQEPPSNARRTGLRWGAWLAGDAPAGAVGSCRFWPKPISGLRTRVLVLQGPECEYLRANNDWILEGENEFYAVPPSNGACRLGLVPVHRLPNMKPDLNFRWATDPAIIAQMVAQGWVDEGPKFCGRPLGSNE